MVGLRDLLLEIYGGGSYRYTRHSKREKETGARVSDEDFIEGPHLSILGCATPTLFEVLMEGDVLSGLLPRFAVVLPTGKPARRPFYTAGVGGQQHRDRLVAWMQQIHTWAAAHPQPVRVDAAALDALDAFDQAIETQAARAATEAGKIMLQRLTAMAVKVAMLTAVGRPGAAVADAALHVSRDDAASALAFLARWRDGAGAFVANLGASRLEQTIARALKLLPRRGPIRRRELARGLHVSKPQMDVVEATLVDRGLIRLGKAEASSGPPAATWERA
jgi:hypothetical protein